MSTIGPEYSSHESCSSYENMKMSEVIYSEQMTQDVKRCTTLPNSKVSLHARPAQEGTFPSNQIAVENQHSKPELTTFIDDCQKWISE